MTRLAIVPVACLLAMLTGCSKVVFESNPAAGATHRVLQLSRPDNIITGIVDPEARQPDVSFDGQKVAFIRRALPGPAPQVFVMTIGDPGSLKQVTKDTASKSLPRWAVNGRIAFRAGNTIRVLNPEMTQFNLGTPALVADGGLDFYENGRALVYERDGNLYVVPLDRSVPEAQITRCASPTIHCGFPVVSFDQTKLAYHHTVMLSSGWPESIHILNAGSWTNFGSFMMGPPLGGGGKIHSFDFARHDKKIMFVSAKPYDTATASYGSDLLLFEVRLDGSGKQQLAPAPYALYPSAR